VKTQRVGLIKKKGLAKLENQGKSTEKGRMVGDVRGPVSRRRGTGLKPTYNLTSDLGRKSRPS